MGQTIVRCEQVQELIHAHIDGELDILRNLEMETHFTECEICEAEHREHLNLRTLVQSGAQFYVAPDSLRQKIADICGPERTVGTDLGGRPFAAPIKFSKETAPASPNTIKFRGRPRRAVSTVLSDTLDTRRWLAAAAVVILAVSGVLLWMIVSRSQTHTEDMLAQEVVSGHIRSMMLDHLVDVPSTDQHTVKPWFNGKLDFAPEVKDLAEQGFPLLGGRLDYIDNRTVAALVYQRRRHSINLFIWPSFGAADHSAQQLSVNGYNVIHWSRSGTSYWAVSDVNNTDLTEFAQLICR